MSIEAPFAYPGEVSAQPDAEALRRQRVAESMYTDPLVRSAIARAAYGAGASPNDIDDVLQGTVMRLALGARRYDGQGVPPAMAAVTARNIVIDDWRARQCRPQVVDTELRDMDPGAAGNAPEGVDGLLTTLVVREALRDLGAEHREILHSIYYEGMTKEEAAKSLGIPLGTAKSRAYYGLRALRRVLATRGIDKTTT